MTCDAKCSIFFFHVVRAIDTRARLCVCVWPRSKQLRLFIVFNSKLLILSYTRNAHVYLFIICVLFVLPFSCATTIVLHKQIDGDRRTHLTGRNLLVEQFWIVWKHTRRFGNHYIYRVCGDRSIKVRSRICEQLTTDGIGFCIFFFYHDLQCFTRKTCFNR